MKKNNVMRVFSLLLALTLISVCAISGTFAKYVTKVEGEDQARVAKWGVVLDVKGNAFSTKYQAHDQAYIDAFENAEDAFSVIAENEDQVVAPGTSSKDLDQTLVATVTGKPEVAARYILTGSVDDIVLKAGTYTDYTELVKADDGTYGYTDTFTLAKNYSPVKWNLKISKNGGTPINFADALYEGLGQYPDLLAKAEAEGLTPSGCSFFSAVEILKKVAGNPLYEKIVGAALGQIVTGGRNFQLDVTEDGNFTLSYDFDPNKEMNFTFELSWEWKFSDVEENEVSDNDRADTFLGNWAAVKLGQTIDGFVEPAAPSSVEISANLTATAVQID